MRTWVINEQDVEDFKLGFADGVTLGLHEIRSSRPKDTSLVIREPDLPSPTPQDNKTKTASNKARPAEFGPVTRYASRPTHLQIAPESRPKSREPQDSPWYWRGMKAGKEASVPIDKMLRGEPGNESK